jgi:hypothetical protein
VRFGYHLGTDGKTLEPNPAEQAVIAHVRALRGEGFSLRSIVDDLALNGLVSRAGKAYQLTQVRRMVQA